jgi:single-stranded-DNA-specific exonuclease
MFLRQPLLELLIARGIQDVDEFLKPPSTNDFANPFFLTNLEEAASRVLKAVREGARIAVFGDYDCDGVLATHVLESVLRRLGAAEPPAQALHETDYGRQGSQEDHDCNRT